MPSRSASLARSRSPFCPPVAHAAKPDSDRELRATSTPTALQESNSSSTAPNAVTASANPTRPIRPARARHSRVREGRRNSPLSAPSNTTAASADQAGPEAAASKADDDGEPRETSKSIQPSVSGHRRSGLQCSLCGATFSRQEHLTRHVRSHADDRPFACGVCGRRFTRRDTLKRHEARHQ
ncbi:uncharacterized protein J3D65DRAFT_560191, partial [Phyllosticta citribraziliensis]